MTASPRPETLAMGASRMISLTLNGRPVTAEAEGRTNLADFVRDTLNLTGTHLGC